MHINKLALATTTAVMLCGGVLADGIISINFRRDNSEAFAGGQNIGPLATDSANWNGVTGASGTLNNLIDDGGNPTSADVVWQASTVWSTSEAYTNDQQRLSRGYLDDGNIGDGLGISVTITDIPYAKYRVYGLLASDLSNGGGSYTTLDFRLNGSVWVFGGVSSANIAAYGNVTVNMNNHGEYWTEVGGGVIGNYWTQVASGSNLVVRGTAKTGTPRGCLTGIIIEEIDIPNTISINFAQNTNQDFADGSGIGPLSTDSATWNSTINSDAGNLASGTKANLIDVFGHATGVSATWLSANTWYNGTDGVTTDNRKLAVGYLDDGNAAGTPCSVTFSNIPYATYRVYGLVSSDIKPLFVSRDAVIQGGMFVRGGASEINLTSSANITTNFGFNGEWWTETSGTVTGNYWTVITSGSNLTVQGQNRIGTSSTRGSLAGIVIEEVTGWYMPTNRTIGFNFRGSKTADIGIMDFNAVAGAPMLRQRYWGNLQSDWFNDAAAIPPRYFDSFGRLVGLNNVTNNGLRIEFDTNTLFNNGIDETTSADHVLMKGYFDSTTSATQPYVQIWNIPYEKFDIVIYADGDGNNGSKCGAYWIEEATVVYDGNGADLTPLIYTEQIGTPHFDGTYTQVQLSSTSAATASAGNYIVFAGLTHPNVTIRGKQESGTRAPINAFQIVDRTPPPGPVYPVGTVILIQ